MRSMTSERIGPWHRSSYSGGAGGNCVESAPLTEGAQAIRDSKHPEKGHLSFSAQEWHAFLTAVKTQRF